jgi:hypothetical protein
MSGKRLAGEKGDRHRKQARGFDQPGLVSLGFDAEELRVCGIELRVAKHLRHVGNDV